MWTQGPGCRIQALPLGPEGQGVSLLPSLEAATLERGRRRHHPAVSPTARLLWHVELSCLYSVLPSQSNVCAQKYFHFHHAQLHCIAFSFIYRALQLSIIFTYPFTPIRLYRFERAISVEEKVRTYGYTILNINLCQAGGGGGVTVNFHRESSPATSAIERQLTASSVALCQKRAT